MIIVQVLGKYMIIRYLDPKPKTKTLNPKQPYIPPLKGRKYMIIRYLDPKP